MENDAKSEISSARAEELSKAYAAIAERSQRIVSDFLERQSHDQTIAGHFDPLHIGDAFLQMTAQMLASPAKLVEAQMSMWNDYMQIWQRTARQMLGGPPDAVPSPSGWHEQDIVDFIKQSYLLTARWIQSLVKSAQPLQQESAQKVDFYTRQFIDAMAPASFFANNPDLLRTTIDSQGENLLKGLDRLLATLEQGKSRLAQQQPLWTADRPGQTIGATPGEIIFVNRLIELRYYPATGPNRQATPLLILPSWTHKYYILDLRPDNSLVKWAVEQGYGVYLLCWRDEEQAAAPTTLDDIMALGPLGVLPVIRQRSGSARLHGLGYGMGGTLLAACLALLAAKGDDCFVSATFLASMMDFSDVGTLSVFIDEERLRVLDQPAPIGPALSLLRANDLIWSFVLDHYRDAQRALPFPFDLLSWIGDTPHPPAALQHFHLHQLYEENLLSMPGGLVVDGVGLDLRRVALPCYVVAAAEDHIAPWKAVFAATRLLGGNVRIIRAESGHEAAIINPPSDQRHGFWTQKKTVKDADSWLKGAIRQDGSWWPDWLAWLAHPS